MSSIHPQGRSLPSDVEFAAMPTPSEGLACSCGVSAYTAPQVLPQHHHLLFLSSRYNLDKCTIGMHTGQARLSDALLCWQQSEEYVE
ncbi:hypothetical protein E2C01_044585 [Portunus trituberculatus]|uniref:Uncharacterized protein n=1 Tax=Portunus trituberculatus TaxID=210409 RepID=A0A5B7FZM0_PORTR|nr:hypothetical protein [Portunus trituberculatus]